MRGFPAYFTRKQELATVDKAMNMVAVIHPATALPQVIKIYATHNVTGISLLTWILFMAIGVVFMAYAVLHKVKPMILLQTLWFLVDGAVVLGVLLYA